MKSTVRCSELDRILACPGSRKLAGLVASRQGTEGSEGTRIHWEIAWKLVRELGAEQPEGGLSVHSILNHLPKSSEWIIGFCFRALRDSLAPGWALEVEAAIAYEFARFLLSGHIDALALNPDATEAAGWDWKTGYNAVDPADQNEQFCGYIVLIKRAYPSVKKITFTGVQPRNNEEDGFERISTVVVEGEALESIVDRFEVRINTSLDRENEIETGISQCAWCPVGVQCPLIQKEIETMKTNLTPELLARIKSEADDGLLGDIAIASKVIERPIDDAIALLKDRIEAQGQVVASSGTRITAKTTKGAYKILDPVAMYNGVHDLIASRERIAEALSYPVGRLKDALAEDRDIAKTGKSGQSADEIFDAALAPYCEQGTRKILQFH